MTEVVSGTKRIPSTLQAVFLASNRGKDVHKPPSKMFSRNWFFQRKAGVENRKVSSKSRLMEEDQETPVSPSLKQTKMEEEQEKKPVVPPSSLKQTKVRAKARSSTPPCSSLQGYIDVLMHSRGYSTKRFTTLQSAYYNKPTPLQQASYDSHLLEVTRTRDFDKLKSVLSSGISPNPCNQYGESLVHRVCRLGDHELLESFLENGCSVQVSDDYGRTPLHDACRAATPALETVKLILKADPGLIHMADCHGSIPFAGVRKEHWSVWIEFIKENKDEFWPSIKDGKHGPPLLTLNESNTRPLLDPKNALTIELAKMVASGRIEPEEAQFLKHDQDGEETAEMTDEPSDDGDYDCDYDSDSDSDHSFGSQSTFDDDEMNDILLNLTALQSKPISWSSNH
jgi:hypothetical protein